MKDQLKFFKRSSIDKQFAKDLLDYRPSMGPPWRKHFLWAESLLEVFYRQMMFLTTSMESRTSRGCLWTKDPCTEEFSKVFYVLKTPT